jgi:nucleoside-diphosphate-sugar epimerase
MRRVLVTGGGGFVGSAIVRRLRARGVEVRVLARGDYPELVALGCDLHRVDLSDAEGVRRAADTCDTVFHVAARAGIWGRREDFEATNVRGTENVLASCRSAGVARLIHTSSPSVTFDGHDHVDAGADLPYPTRWLADYPRTKALAEQAVRAASSRDFPTVCLRPHLVYGPGDPHLLPRLLARARAGRLRVVGRGDNRVSLTYVDNAAAAHLQAADALARAGAACPAAGNAYFVNDAEPVDLWPWLGRLFDAVGVPPVRGRVPRALAYAVGAAAELAWSVLPLAGEPPMTRFAALQLATHHTYDLAPARAAFGYAPEVDGEEGFVRTVRALRGGEGTHRA